MKYRFFTILLLCLSPTAFAQEGESAVVHALPDKVMEQVVRRIATYYFKPARRPTVVYFSDENLRIDWLPEIPNIRFVVLERNKIMQGTIGYVFTIKDKKDDVYTIGFGYGELGCDGGGEGVAWSLRVRENSVRLWRNSRTGYGWTCHSNASG